MFSLRRVGWYNGNKSPETSSLWRSHLAHNTCSLVTLVIPYHKAMWSVTQKPQKTSLSFTIHTQGIESILVRNETQNIYLSSISFSCAILREKSPKSHYFSVTIL